MVLYVKRHIAFVATGKHGNGVLGERRDGFGHSTGTIVRPCVFTNAGTHHHGLVDLLGIGIGKSHVLFYRLKYSIKIIGTGVA